MCCGVNICAIPPNSKVQNLMLQGMILGGGAFGGHGVGPLNGISGLIKEVPES